MNQYVLCPTHLLLKDLCLCLLISSGRLALINKTIEAWYTSPHSFNKSVVRKLDFVIKSIEELSLQFKNTSETIKASVMQSMHLLNNFHLCVVSNVGLLDFALPSYGNSHHPS